MSKPASQPTRRIPSFLKPLDGYPGGAIESLDALGPNTRVTWLPDRGPKISLLGQFTAEQLRAMADMMEATVNG